MLEKFDSYRFTDGSTGRLYQATKCQLLSEEKKEWYWRLDIRSGKSFFVLTEQRFYSIDDVRLYLKTVEGVENLVEHPHFTNSFQ